MRALTVRQPWCWAIVHGGKDVENRTRNVAGSYRGPVAVHAGQAYESHVAPGDPVLQAAIASAHERLRLPELAPLPGSDHGVFIGVADLVSVHHDSDHGPHRCSEWAMAGDWHLMLANPRPLEVPIPARGTLGLWTPPADLLEQLQAVTQ